MSECSDKLWEVIQPVLHVGVPWKKVSLRDAVVADLLVVSLSGT
jgi:hypothetical protein